MYFRLLTATKEMSPSLIFLLRKLPSNVTIDTSSSSQRAEIAQWEKWRVVGFMAVWHSWQWHWNCSHLHCIQIGSGYSLCTNKNQKPTVRGKAVAAWHWSVTCMQCEGPEILRFSQHCIEHSTVLRCGAMSVGNKIPEQYNHVYLYLNTTHVLPWNCI